MQDELHNKLAHLKEYIKDLGSVAIAFSSGCGFYILLKVAHDVLGDKVMAVTVQSGSFPKRELNEAIAFCTKEKIRHQICQVNEMNIEGFAQNPPNRCYLCKHALFEKIGIIAKKNEIAYVAEGSNMDDLGDYRPGLQAVAELGVKSPLREAKLTKAEIRLLSKEMGLRLGTNHRLPVWLQDLYTEKQSAKRSWSWWKMQSSYCSNMASGNFVSVCME